MAFTITNIDDILILVIFFSEVNHSFRRRHVVVGQYLGFSVLVGLSLLGSLGSLIIPLPWIGLLGLIPIYMGVRKLLDHNPQALPAALGANSPPSKVSFLHIFLNPHTYQVAAVTVGNGGDNIGIYIPLFASSSRAELGVLLGTFFLMVGIWCLAGYYLARQPTAVMVLDHYGRVLVPMVLIGLGIFILAKCGTLSLLGL